MAILSSFTLLTLNYVLFSSCFVQTNSEHAFPSTTPPPLVLETDALLGEFSDWAGEKAGTTFSSSAMVTESVPGAVIVSSCNAFINYYGDVAANYTQCAVRNARPLQFCENCTETYVKSAHIYKLIMEGSIKNEDNRTCKKILLESDRVQIVVKTNEFISQLWKECDCENCFDYHLENGTVKYTLNNDTKHFWHLNHNVLECFRNNSEHFYIYDHGSANNTVCDQCEPAYHELSLHYDHLELKAHRDVCMDVVDAMNRTRRMWSQEFLCREVHKDITVVIVIASVFTLLPIIFYISNMAYGARLNRKLVQQKRFRDVQASCSVSQSVSQTEMRT